MQVCIICLKITRQVKDVEVKDIDLESEKENPVFFIMYYTDEKSMILMNQGML